MKVHFTKMQGAGNDYIYINGFDTDIQNPKKLAASLSDRHFGIGGDGLVLICPSEQAHAKMRMFNADGSEGNMCGNALRCVGKYLYDHAMVEEKTLTIETKSGLKTLELLVKDNKVYQAVVDMGAPALRPEHIPVLLEGEHVIAQKIQVEEKDYTITCVSMGNPHCVLFLDEIASLNLNHIGPKFEHLPLFPQRVNTEFVTVENRTTLSMRVWERGSGETMACGTGASAAVVAAVLNQLCDKNTEIEVKLRGGTLYINYTGETVYMRGDAVTVFEGVIEL